nr:transcriptional regulator, LysR family [Kibdelosporangium sp. MJ126-NF4]
MRGFIAVAEEGNFHKAAQRLRMTQPPLSRQIQRLEREVGVVLFDRTQRKVELTAAGTAFLAEARRLLALAAAAPDTARRVSQGQTGTVRMGFTAASGLGFLGHFLNRLDQELPEVQLILNEMVTSAQLENLRNGILDLALARPPFDDNEFDSQLLHSEPLVLAVPGHHRLAKGTTPVTVDALSGETLLVYTSDQAGYFANLVSRVLAGVAYTPAHRLTQVHTMLALVAAGRGLALVPEATTHLHPDGVRFRALAGVANFPAVLHAVWRRESRNPALLRVIALLESISDKDDT